ncbi:hypothetical protein AS030_21285 [Fictibacillus enclensis]|uniref:Uncharacterized protein n=1 Tax=Fictibacillus enclensis TaxID=1017270 RepID=A0A0V8IYA5_9BACL|nr:hypothetical protein AS030_21285 [Fictibacillus enclensis]
MQKAYIPVVAVFIHFVKSYPTNYNQFIINRMEEANMKQFAKVISTFRADLAESMKKYGAARIKMYTHL